MGGGGALGSGSDMRTAPLIGEGVLHSDVHRTLDALELTSTWWDRNYTVSHESKQNLKVSSPRH